MKAATPNQELLERLLSCHERIRRFSRLALRIAEQPEHPQAERAQAAEQIAYYFTHGLPGHTTFEERVVLPSLQGLDESVDRALLQMEREHRDHEPIVAQCVDRLQALIASPTFSASIASELAVAARSVIEDFDVHLANEEKIVFPRIETHLTASQAGTLLERLRGS